MSSVSVKKAIKIFARLKPSDTSTCKYEIDKHVNDDGSTDDILVLNSSSSMNALNNNLDEYQSNASLNRPDSYKFRFSKVFDDSSTQDDVFSEICQPVLESALQGYNSTIFAYGQTGSGKTYTMTGSRQQWKNRGIIPRSLSYIFEKFNELTDQGYIASAFLSYLEIYNENGYDLLHSGFSSGRIEDLKKVQLLEDSQQQIHMRNLTVHPIKSEDEAMQLLYLGDHNRIIAETPMNEASTRSHCIFTIHLNIREGTSSTVRRSKVHLVDLAGSERLTNTTSTGQLFNEARHINLALHYLEQVIVALGEAHRSHIPYRNSMMTSILRDSLEGNCMTSMVATLSLEHRNVMETLSTCRFSQRVALVQNAAILNEETDPMLLIAQLKTENKRLKDIIANSCIKTLDSCTGPLSQEEVADCWKLVERFVADADEEAILSVAPDMRIVQTCFRCLKMAVQMNKEDLIGISPAMALVNSGSSASPYPDGGTRYDDTTTREQLVECLKIRDAEIEVLKKMLRPTGPASRKKNSPFRQPASPSGRPPSSHFEYGDGLNPTSKRMTSSFREEENDNCNPAVNPNYQKMTIDHLHEKEDDSQDQAEDSVGATSLLNFIGSTEQADHTSPSDHDLFPENLFIDGFSDPKRQALDSFKRSYKGAEKLLNQKKALSAKRNEVDSIETLLRRNHANLKNLKVVLMSSEGGAEDEDLFMKEAVQSQSQSIQKQERQLMKTREELQQLEDSLKGLYAQFFSEFEKQWVSMREFRERSGIPSEIDIFVGTDEPRTDGVDSPSTQPSKPFSEMTKGIIKGVGGNKASPRQNFSKKSPRGGNSMMSNAFYVSAPPPPAGQSIPPPAHTSKSCYAQSSARARSRSARRSSSSTRGKQQTPNHSPRVDSIGGRSPKAKPPQYSQPSPYQFNKPKHHPPPSSPTRTPASASISTPPIQLLHRHQHTEFPSEASTDNFVGYYKQHKGRERDADPDLAPVVDYEKDDDELIKELPMTGDATVDQEILSFFTRRQAIFRQINSDKNSSKSGEEDVNGNSGNGRSNHAGYGKATSSQQRYDLDFATSYL